MKKIRVLVFFLLGSLILVSFFLSFRKQRISYLVDTALKKYSSAALESGYFHFDLYFLNIYLGRFLLSMNEGAFQGKEIYEGNLSLKPPSFLRKLSGDRIGLDVSSIIDQRTLLPYYFEQNDAFRKKRGKKGRIIEYHHDQLMMVRKGKIEDIEDDTRDYASLVAWVMKQDYTQKTFLKSTLNINRTIYLVLAKVQGNSLAQDTVPLVKLKIKFIELTKDYQGKDELIVDACLFKVNDYYLPLLLKFRKGLFVFTVSLN